MSASVKNDLSVAVRGQQHTTPIETKHAPASNGSYKGFVAGVFSGIAKLTGQSGQNRLVDMSTNRLYSWAPFRHDQGPTTDVQA